jgi:hypothetical protein
MLPPGNLATCLSAVKTPPTVSSRTLRAHEPAAFGPADRTNLVVVGAEAKEATVPDVSERESWDISPERHEQVIPV